MLRGCEKSCCTPRLQRCAVLGILVYSCIRVGAIHLAPQTTIYCIQPLASNVRHKDILLDCNDLQIAPPQYIDTGGAKRIAHTRVHEDSEHRATLQSGRAACFFTTSEGIADALQDIVGVHHFLPATRNLRCPRRIVFLPAVEFPGFRRYPLTSRAGLHHNRLAGYLIVET